MRFTVTVKAERDIEKLHPLFQQRMARYALRGWKFIPEEDLMYDRPGSGYGWDAFPPGKDDECVWASTLRELLERLGEPEDEADFDLTIQRRKQRSRKHG